MKQMVDDRSVCIRAAYQRFVTGEQQRCLDAINAELDAEGFIPLLERDTDSILLARATGTLPGDGMPGQQPEPVEVEPVEPVEQDQQADGLCDVLRQYGGCERCD